MSAAATPSAPAQQPMRKRRFVPTVMVDAEVSLDEFCTEDILKYLRDQGEGVAIDSGEGIFLSQGDLNRCETLALCGQVDAARKYILDIVSQAIGRPL